MKSASYFRSITRQQAKDAGFGSNVGAYLKSWKSEARARAEERLASHFLNACALPLFGHVLWRWSLAVPGYIVQGGGEPWTVGLHALQTAQGWLSTRLAGRFRRASHWLAAAAPSLTPIVSTAFVPARALTMRSTIRRRRCAVIRHGYTRCSLKLTSSKGSLADIDQATNIAGDFLLLRKPAFKAESIAAGDLPSAMNSAYVGASSHWAYGYLQAGRSIAPPQCSKVDKEPNRLVCPTSKLIKAKAAMMTEDQFRFHVAELYAKGPYGAHDQG